MSHVSLLLQAKQVEAETKRQEKRNQAFVPPKEPSVTKPKTQPAADTKVDLRALKAKLKKSQVMGRLGCDLAVKLHEQNQ